jgi:membrane protein implicated in regulation of membrane protease activity
MDPIPPPDHHPTPGRWLSLLLTGVFLLMAGWGWVDRKEHKDELRRQGEELKEIKAMLLEQRQRQK